MIKKFGDIISGGAFLLFSLTLFSMSQRIEVSTISEYGGSVVPKGIAVIMGILSVLVIIGGVRKSRGPVQWTTGQADLSGSSSHNRLLPLVAIIFVSVVYIMLLNSIGFVIMTALCLSCQMFILSGFNKKRILLFILISTMFSFIIEYIFVSLFYLMLPSGILG